MVRTKEYMLNTCKKLDFYVSSNLKKEEMARRIAREILDNPLAVLCSLSKSDLQLVDEFVKVGSNQYITKKMCKTQYKLQKYSLILTYEDFEAGEWKMLMPDSVRESLAVSLPAIPINSRKNRGSTEIQGFADAGVFEFTVKTTIFMPFEKMKYQGMRLKRKLTFVKK